MPNTKSHLKRIISFRLLMKRYARRLVHNEADASKIVQHVLQAENIPYSEMPDKRLRQVLKFDVRNHCIYHNQSKIFDRPLIKV